jgi:hypothetical protein
VLGVGNVKPNRKILAVNVDIPYPNAPRKKYLSVEEKDTRVVAAHKDKRVPKEHAVKRPEDSRLHAIWAKHFHNLLLLMPAPEGVKKNFDGDP